MAMQNLWVIERSALIGSTDFTSSQYICSGGWNPKGDRKETQNQKLNLFKNLWTS